MGENYLLNPIEFLVQALLGLVTLVLMLRFLLQLVRADFYNPLSQLLQRVTRPVLEPLRRFLPGSPRVDGATLVALLLVQMVTLATVAALRGGSLGLLPLLLWSFAELVSMTINVFLFSIIVQVVMSWINPGHRNPMMSLLHSLNQPLLRPARRWLPPFSGLDLSPILVVLGLQLLKMMLVPPLMAAARAVQ